jgi:hypothetical protein
MGVLLEEMGKVKTLRNKKVVIERNWQFAPTYQELRDTIRQLVELHGEDEVIGELGLNPLRIDGMREREWRIWKNRETFYKGIEIVWDEDFDKRIFIALDQIEKDHPDVFKHIVKAGEHEGELTIWVDTEDIELPGSIEFDKIIEAVDCWSIIKEF